VGGLLRSVPFRQDRMPTNVGVCWQRNWARDRAAGAATDAALLATQLIAAADNARVDTGAFFVKVNGDRRYLIIVLATPSVTCLGDQGVRDPVNGTTKLKSAGKQEVAVIPDSM
jgi:hypothetical protein